MPRVPVDNRGPGAENRQSRKGGRGSPTFIIFKGADTIEMKSSDRLGTITLTRAMDG